MRPKLLHLALLALLFFLYVFVSHVRAFIQLFFEHAGYALEQDVLLAEYKANSTQPREQFIPKIVHGVYHSWYNTSMPEDWQENRRVCAELNPDWEFKIWTDETSREFLATHYEWFLSTYDSYIFRIQRIDTVRYFILRHYGGIYLDLDNGCLTNLDPLLYYPAWTTDGGRGALSNNILASSPQHPFWVAMTDSLISYNYNYLFPYITISYASGQWFHTAVWEKYHAALSPTTQSTTEVPLPRIMMDNRNGLQDKWIFFSQERGGSWGNWDNLMFLWLGEHLFLFGFGIVSLIALGLWLVYRIFRCCTSRFGDRTRYSKLDSNRKEDDEGSV